MATRKTIAHNLYVSARLAKTCAITHTLLSLHCHYLGFASFKTCKTVDEGRADKENITTRNERKKDDI